MNLQFCGPASSLQDSHRLVGQVPRIWIHGTSVGFWPGKAPTIPQPKTVISCELTAEFKAILGTAKESRPLGPAPTRQTRCASPSYGNEAENEVRIGLFLCRRHRAEINSRPEAPSLRMSPINLCSQKLSSSKSARSATAFRQSRQSRTLQPDAGNTRTQFSSALDAFHDVKRTTNWFGSRISRSLYAFGVQRRRADSAPSTARRQHGRSPNCTVAECEIDPPGVTGRRSNESRMTASDNDDRDIRPAIRQLKMPTVC